jgi:hypothetical protein
MFCFRGIVTFFSLVAYRVLGNHAEAEDAVQNCLLTVTDNVPGSNRKVLSVAG